MTSRGVDIHDSVDSSDSAQWGANVSYDQDYSTFSAVWFETATQHILVIRSGLVLFRPGLDQRMTAFFFSHRPLESIGAEAMGNEMPYKISPLPGQGAFGVIVLRGMSPLPHSFRREYARFGRAPGIKLVRAGAKMMSANAEKRPRTVHPLVYPQPETGRNVLNVSPWFADGIYGMENAEGDAILGAVIEHCVLEHAGDTIPESQRISV